MYCRLSYLTPKQARLKALNSTMIHFVPLKLITFNETRNKKSDPDMTQKRF